MPYDLAVEARLRRERDRERGRSGAHVREPLCLGPQPMSRGKRLFWTLPFLVGGALLVAGSVVGTIASPGLFDLVIGAIGLVMTAISTYVFLGAFNPQLALVCDRATFAPGEPATIRWRFSTPPRRARSLTISLQAFERATYRQGTSDTTATETVFEEVRVDVEAGPAGPPTEGSFELGLPADAMHSFESENNEFEWRLRAVANVPRWPDIRRDAPVRVWAGPAPEPAREQRP